MGIEAMRSSPCWECVKPGYTHWSPAHPLPLPEGVFARHFGTMASWYVVPPAMAAEFARGLGG
jgi:hypothetical protein